MVSMMHERKGGAKTCTTCYQRRGRTLRWKDNERMSPSASARSNHEGVITRRKRQRRRKLCAQSPRISRSGVFALILAAGFFHFSSSYLPVPTTRLRFVRLQLSSSPEEGIGVGIDLGTTYSAIAIMRDGTPTIVPVPNNGRTMPSVVSLTSGGDFVVGKEAIEIEVQNPLGSYRNVKRIIGTGGTMAQANAEVVPNVVLSAVKRGKKNKKIDQPSLEKQLQEAEENPALLNLPPSSSGSSRETVSPEVISAQILKKLFETVEHHTGQSVTRAVVGVPAYFNDAQREATIRACNVAGVSKVKLLREPEAAALAYGICKEQAGEGDKDELVLVFDLGGGTFDVSVLMVGGGLTEVVCTSGNVRLGGSDFDARITQHFSRILTNHGASRNFLSDGGEAADAMIRSAEAVRIHLSNNRKVSLALPLDKESWSNLSHATEIIMESVKGELSEEGISNSTHVLCELSRKTMEGLCREEFEALLRPVREVAIMSGAMLPGDARPSVVEATLEMEEEMEQAISEADGGMSSTFEDFYHDDVGKELAASATMGSPSEIAQVLDLQELDMKERKRAQQNGRKKARDVAKRERKFLAEKRKVDESVDTKVRDGISGRPISQVVLVGGATRMPAIGRLLTALTGVVPQRTVNPDEAVATGCAVQVGVLDGSEGVGELTVLTPMQVAIMRAVAEKQGLFDAAEAEDDDFDNDEFERVEYF